MERGAVRDKPIEQRSDSEIILMAAGQYQRSAERFAGDDENGNPEAAEMHTKMAARCAKIAARLKRIDKR
jgi:hypothetical protein